VITATSKPARLSRTGRYAPVASTAPSRSAGWWEAAALILACMRVGALAVPIMPTIRERELERILRETQARICVVPDLWNGFDRAGALTGMANRLPWLRHVVVVGDAASTGAIDFTGYFLRTPHELSPESPAGRLGLDDPDRVRMALFTSGTGGEFKGVLHTHNTLFAGAGGPAGFEERGWDHGEVFCSPHPISYLSPLLYCVWGPILAAGTPGVPKVGNRDLGAVLARGGLGATTVASTMAVADLARIGTVSTGGIGGVHRGAAETFDVSGDLLQLTRSRVAVVCAGVKSILDIGLTLEYLETLGVPVIGYRCDELPAYYCRTSGHRVPQRLDRLADVAAAVDLHWAAGMDGSVVVTTPVDEQDALDSAEMERVIARALDAAETEGVRGPGLMKAVSAATDGRSAAANRAVLLHCARLAGALAVLRAARQV
jgi:pseudouridine-5'-phosphate glycosidase